MLILLARNPADNVAVELNHTEIYIVCQVQDKAKVHLFNSKPFKLASINDFLTAESLLDKS